MPDSRFTTDYDLKSLQLITTKSTDIEMYITPRYREHYCANEYEKFTISWLKKYLKENSIFVDIGAHYGYYSLAASKYGKNISVIAVEPVNANFAILKKNLSHNNVGVVGVHDKAVSDSSGEVIFNVTEASDSAGLYEHPLTVSKEKVKIKSVSLDDLLFDVKNIDVIKIDVEGNEINVLNGMKKLLAKNPQIRIIIEFNPDCQINAGHQPDELIKKLEDMGFDNYLIDEDKEEMYRLSDNKRKWSHFMRKEEYRNILCINKKESLSVVTLTNEENESSTNEIISNLISINVQVNQLSLNKVGQSSDYEMAINKNIVVQIPSWIESGKTNDEEIITSIAKSLDNLFRLSDYITDTNPHVIYTNTIVCYWGAIIACMMKIPHIWSIHKNEFYDNQSKFWASEKEIIGIVSDLSSEIEVDTQELLEYLTNSHEIVNKSNLYLQKDIYSQIKNTINSYVCKNTILSLGLNAIRNRIQELNEVNDLLGVDRRSKHNVSIMQEISALMEDNNAVQERINTLNMEIKSLETVISNITSSKFFKVWQILNKFRFRK